MYVAFNNGLQFLKKWHSITCNHAWYLRICVLIICESLAELWATKHSRSFLWYFIMVHLGLKPSFLEENNGNIDLPQNSFGKLNKIGLKLIPLDKFQKRSRLHVMIYYLLFSKLRSITLLNGYLMSLINVIFNKLDTYFSNNIKEVPIFGLLQGFYIEKLMDLYLKNYTILCHSY